MVRRVVRARVRQALFASGRVVRSRPPESSAKSRRRARQSRPKLFWSPSRFVPRQSLCMASPLESSNKPRQARPVSVRVTRQALQGRPALSESSAVIRRPCQSRPLSVPESGQECRSSSRPPRSSRPAVVHRCRQTRPPSSFPELPRMSRPRQNHSRPPCPPTSSAVPARVARQVPVESVPAASVVRLPSSLLQREGRRSVLAGRLWLRVMSRPCQLLVGVPAANLWQSRPLPSAPGFLE